MLQRSLFIIALISFGSFSFAQNEDYLRYIDQYHEIAIQEMERVGIPASIKLAQGILESDAGRSELARRANNHFGIKCGNDWNGKTVHREDDDYDDRGRLIESCFRSYRTNEASFIAHSEFLLDPRKSYRYGFLFRLDPTDYRAWAYGLKDAGYATSATYPEKLISIIERYDLHKYDLMSTVDAGRPGRPGATIEPVASVMQINDVKYVVALEGETLADIAQRTDVALRSLINYNENVQSENQMLAPGAQIFLQPKRNAYRGKDKYHRVTAGETMFDISQRYGIKLSKLYDRNRMSEGTQPAVGEEIKLRGWKVKEAPELRSKFDEEQPLIDIAAPDENDDGLLDMDEENGIEVTPGRDPANVPPPVINRPIQPGTTPVYPENDVPPVDISNLPPAQPEVEPELPELPPPPPPKDPFTDDQFGNNDTNTTPPVTPTPSTTTEMYHVVVKGDTLYNISKRYSLTVDQLKSLNGLGGNTISIGQRLRVK